MQHAAEFKSCFAPKLMVTISVTSHNILTWKTDMKYNREVVQNIKFFLLGCDDSLADFD